MSSILETIKPYLPAAEGFLPYWLLLVRLLCPRSLPFPKLHPPPHLPLTLTCLDQQFGATAIGNSVQCYLTMHFVSRIYGGPRPATPYVRSSPSAPKHDLSRTKATPLQARSFAAWTFMSAVIRVYSAYHIQEKAFYELAFLTYVVAFGHFMSEWWVYGSCHWGAPIAGPVLGSTASLIWMWLQWGAYVAK